MNLLSFKTLNYDSFSASVKNCLSPKTRKISSYHINSNINIIKSNLKLYNQKLLEHRNKNIEIIETNSRFKKYMDKYYTYKKYIKAKEKHKIKKRAKSNIDILLNTYIKKGYKRPNLEKNIFHVNPLNDKGKTIKKYFDEYIRTKNKLVDAKEKNFFYLNKLKDCIKLQKYKNNNNMLLELNISNPNNEKIKGINYNLSNLVLKRYFNNINNKQCLSENDKDISQDENFLKLNEYEQNNIKLLIKENKEIKRYKAFIDKALKNKKYFNTIDSDEIDLSKRKEIKEINNDLSSININIKNDSNKKENLLRKKYLTKKLSLTLSNHNSNFKQIYENNYYNKYPTRKSNYIGLNMKTFSQKDINLNTKISNKKYSFSKENQNYLNILKTYTNKNIPKLNKEKSLNYLFNNLNAKNTLDQHYINEYKKYFSRNKNMSEADLDEFIKRNYEPKDFYNLVSTVDDIIKNADIEDKCRKNYTKIGKVEKIKKFLDEEKKQDLYINHLLQNFINAKYGKFKLYEYK